jgi:hypothetical protein
VSCHQRFFSLTGIKLPTLEFRMMSHHVWFLPALAITLLQGQLVYAQSLANNSPCPISCGWSGLEPVAWSYHHSLAELEVCNGTVLMEVNIYNDARDAQNQLYFRACTMTGGENEPEVEARSPQYSAVASDANPRQELDSHPRLAQRQALSLNDTAPLAAVLYLTERKAGVEADVSAVQSAVKAIGIYVKSSKATDVAMFARVKNIIAGVYVGAQVDALSATDVINKYHDQLSQAPTQSRLAVQTCERSNSTAASQYFGITYGMVNDFAAVQGAVQGWDRAQCLGGDESTPWTGVRVKQISGTKVSIAPKDSSESAVSPRSRLVARATCSYTQGE